MTAHVAQKRRASQQLSQDRQKYSKSGNSRSQVRDEGHAYSQVESSREAVNDNSEQRLIEDDQATKRAGSVARQDKSRAARALLKQRGLPDIEWQEAALASEFTGKQALDMKFARSLAALAVPPTTSNELRERALEIRKGLTTPKRLLEQLRQPPQYDVELPVDAEDFRATLEGSFNLIWAPAKHNLARTYDWNIERQVEHVAELTGQAYRPSVRRGDDAETTHDIRGADLVRMFVERGPIYPEDSGTNVLDLRKPSGYEFTPAEILEVGLVHQIRERLAKQSAKRSGWSRSATASASDALHSSKSEWMILTLAPSASPFHVDQAGYCTCIVDLEGQKIWCSPRGRWEPNADLFHSLGPFGRAYAQGIGAVGIGVGDVVVQAPGTIHAVHTPCNTLIAGCFFWTAAHFARTIKCIRLSRCDRLHTNEDMGDVDYQNLELVIKNLDMPGLFTEAQLCDIFLEVRRLLQDHGCIGLRADAERYHRTVGRSNLDKSDKRWSHFLGTCQKWWWSRYERQIDAVEPVEGEVEDGMSESGTEALPLQPESRSQTSGGLQSAGGAYNTRTAKRYFGPRRSHSVVGNINNIGSGTSIASMVTTDEEEAEDAYECNAHASDSDTV